jgi:hypothetical protein
MKKSYIICILSIALAACQSSQTSKSSLVDSTRSKLATPVDFKFSFFITGLGDSHGMVDSWTLDTNGIMVVHATRRLSNGKYQKLNALAGLDSIDMDTLRMLILNGKLLTLDSTDLTQQCAGDEHFMMRIVPLSTERPVTLSFDACAADYNLLTGQQRRYFKKFMDWWGRMRVKYRPVKEE